jgi:SEC-C motif-containing protein
MGHDEHFLERLDRVASDHVALALGLYRDHELVRYILTHVRLPDAAERVAVALADGGEGPYVVVARDGGFVTCLGPGMSTGALPVVSRAHLDGLVSKVQRVREGMALAKKRGFDQTRLLERIESAGPAVAREDFVAASAMVGPAVPLLAGVYASWAKTLDEIFPILQAGRRLDAFARRRAERDVARGAWAMAHSATILVDSAQREWVREWASLPAHSSGSPWEHLTIRSAFGFVVRAAWLAGRLGKPMLASYKARFAEAANPVTMREAGWGLLCMALRHSSLRAEALKALQSPPPPQPSAEPWVEKSQAIFREAVAIVQAKEEQLVSEALNLGRDFAIARTCDLPASSRFRFTERARVPDDLVLPALLDGTYDVNNGERGGDLMLIAIAAVARAKAEDFYFPAAVLHALGPPDLEQIGASLVEMRRTLFGVAKTVRREEQPGRNDPCPCGSGKKYKKCHGK